MSCLFVNSLLFGTRKSPWPAGPCAIRQLHHQGLYSLRSLVYDGAHKPDRRTNGGQIRSGLENPLWNPYNVSSSNSIETLSSICSFKNSCSVIDIFGQSLAPKQHYADRLSFGRDEIRHYTAIAPHKSWTIEERRIPK